MSKQVNKNTVVKSHEEAKTYMFAKGDLSLRFTLFKKKQALKDYLELLSSAYTDVEKDILNLESKNKQDGAENKKD